MAVLKVVSKVDETVERKADKSVVAMDVTMAA